MIDPDLILDLDEERRDQVITALATIGYSGVIELMENRLQERLLGGHEDETDEALGARIKLYRRDVAHLRELKSLCDMAKQESN